MIKIRTINLLDIYLSAFLILHKIEPKFELKNGKVSFIFEATEKVYELMNDFNSDVKVPVASYVTAIKALRARMFSVKSQGVVETERRKGFFGNENDRRSME